MTGYLSEEFVIDEYLKVLDDVSFLKGKTRKMIGDLLSKFRQEKSLSQKLDYAKKTWRLLLESSLSFLADDTDGVDKLREYHSNFVEFEEILYGSDPFYRDHTLHVLWVYLLGDYLIRKSITYDGIESSARKLTEGSLSILKKKNEAIWCFACLTHDLGYPMEEVENVNTQIEKTLSILESGKRRLPIIEFSRREDLLMDHVLRILSSILDEHSKGVYSFISSDSMFFQYSREMQTFNHGIMSCFLLMKTLTYFMRFPYQAQVGITLRYDKSTDSGFEEAIKGLVCPYEILQAIGNHSFRNAEFTRYNTFPFLLVLVDEIEEFSRCSRAGLLRYKEEDLCKVQVHRFDDRLIHVELNYTGSGLDKGLIKGFFKDKYERFSRVIQKSPKNNINLRLDMSIAGLKYTFENLQGTTKILRNQKRIYPSDLRK